MSDEPNGDRIPATPPPAMSLPDDPSQVPHDPPNPAVDIPGISETDSPRDAIFLTEAQALRRRVDAIGAQLVAQNLLLAAVLAIGVYLVVKHGKVPPVTP